MTPSTLIPASLPIKGRLLGGCALIGFTLALSLAPATRAQLAAGFEPGLPPAGVTLGESGPITNVTVSNTETLIRWLPTDNAPSGGAIDLLPTGSTLNFYGSGDYTVLNQIVDNSGGAMQRMIELNGAINSYDNATSGFGGNIWFQNAGGILVGQSGVINVGSLILTSNAIDTTGGFFSSENAIRFGGTASSGAVTNLGSITASGGSGANYVALVAPRIVQTGTVQANGSIAYIAAEAANLTINNGLFDIELLVGANGGVVLDHSGTSETLAGESNQKIYMASLAKNDAISMLVSGNIGHQASTAAVTSAGSIILASGYHITGGAVGAAADGSGADNIELGAGRYNGDAIGHATGTISADIATGAVLEASGVLALAGDTVRLDVDGGTVRSELGMTLRADGLADATTGNSQGGTAELIVRNGGVVSSSDGRILLSASAAGGISSAGTNGNAVAGTVSVDLASGGEIIAASLELEARASGASGQIPGTAGGTGRGGTVDLTLDDGIFDVGQVILDASGDGGDGGGSFVGTIAGGHGGNGQGGNITMSVGASAVVSQPDFQITATGIGGRGGGFFSSGGTPGATGNGGDGAGGTAIFSDSRLSESNLTLAMDASGRGGDAGYLEADGFGAVPPPLTGSVGGSGQGGSVSAQLGAAYDGAFVNLVADGSGGRGALHLTGGAGGAGTGGSATLTADNNSPNLSQASWSATGTGGEGGQGRYGNGGAGGAGTGGSAILLAQGSDADFIIFPASMDTTGTGGAGGDGSSNLGSLPPLANISGGDGGAGAGGILRFGSSQGARLFLGSNGSAGTPLSSRGVGGNGGSSFEGAAGHGASGTGGTVELVATGGLIQQDSDLTITADASGGAGGSGTSGEGTSGTTSGGTIRLLAADAGADQGIITLTNVSLSANGDDAGRIIMHARDGGAISAENLTINAIGQAAPTDNNSLSADSGVILQAEGGTITSNGPISIETGGSIGVHASGAGSIAAATGLLLDAGDQVEIRHSNRLANGATLASGGNINIAAVNSVFADAGSLIRSGEGLGIEASGNVNLGSLDLADGSTNIVSGDGSIAIGNLASSGLLSLSGTSVTVDQGGDLFFQILSTSGGNASINTSGTLTLGSGEIAGDASFNSTGDLEIIGLSASGSIDVTSGQILSINGTVEAPSITLTSRDINLGSGAYLGSLGDESSITLINSDATRSTYVGGSAPQNGYHIDSQEMQALFGTTVRIVAPDVTPDANSPPNAPAMVIGDFSLDMESRGPAFELRLETAGRIRVEGSAELTYAYNSDHRLALTAGEAIDVIMGQAALRVSAPGSAPGGTLALSAPRIMAATEAAFADLAGATTVEDYESRLAQNDGFAASEAYLSAATIDVSVQTGFFTQNNGEGTTIDARRGVAFGAGGLNLTTNADAMLVLNGVQESPNGGTLTGSAAITGITINGGSPASASFNRQSLMNSCLISSPDVCGADALRPPVIPFIPVQDVIENSAPDDEEEVTANERETTGMPDMLISVRDMEPLTGAPLVDDPVTGAGNDDLWGPVTD